MQLRCNLSIDQTWDQKLDEKTKSSINRSKFRSTDQKLNEQIKFWSTNPKLDHQVKVGLIDWQIKSKISRYNGDAI